MPHDAGVEAGSPSTTDAEEKQFAVFADVGIKKWACKAKS
jgi:hypothetical protein